MNIVFDLKSVTTKLYLSAFVIMVFYLLYLTIPDAEFNNVSQSNCKMDRLYYTISSHTGFRNIDSLIPKSLRARVLSLLHMLIAYSILIL
jgi:hypothetical protein